MFPYGNIGRKLRLNASNVPVREHLKLAGLDHPYRTDSSRELGSYRPNDPSSKERTCGVKMLFFPACAFGRLQVCFLWLCCFRFFLSRRGCFGSRWLAAPKFSTAGYLGMREPMSASPDGFTSRFRWPIRITCASS